jgi:hypothetical protein
MMCLCRHRGEAKEWLQNIRYLGAGRRWGFRFTSRPIYLRETSGFDFAGGWVARVRKISPILGFDHVAFQPVAYLRYPGHRIYQIHLYYEDRQYTARRTGGKVFNFLTLRNELAWA